MQIAITQRSFLEKGIKMIRLASRNTVRTLSTTPSNLVYNKRGHFRSNHCDELLDSVDNDVVYKDFLGPAFSRQYYGIVSNAYPNIQGNIVKFIIKRPAKPNSANRRFTKVKITGRTKVVEAKIPHEGHTLQEYSTVKVMSGKTNDVPGAWWEVNRGRLDFTMDQPGKKFHKRNRYGRLSED